MRFKKFLFLFILTFFFIFSPEVKAEEPLTAIGECSYSFIKGVDKVYEQYMSGTNLNFYFTEITFKNKEMSGKVFIKDNQIGYRDYESLNLLYDYQYLRRNPAETDKNDISTTFKRLYEENGAKCPKYFLHKKIGEERYKPYFSNNDPSEYCGTNNENCLTVAKANGDGNKTEIYSSEKVWSFDLKGDKGCDNVNVNIKVDSTGKLKADIWYPKISTYYESSAQKTVSVYVSMNSSSDDLTLNYIINFFKNNTIEKGMVRGDKGNEKVIFNDSAIASGSCSFPTNLKLTNSSKCTNFDSIRTDINTKQTAATLAGEKIDNIALKYLNYDKNNNSYSPKSMSNNSADTLLAYAKEIKSVIEHSNYKETTTTFIAYLEDLLVNDDICLEAKTSIKNIISDKAKTIEDTKNKINALEETLKKIKTNLEEMNEPAKAEEVQNYVDAVQKYSNDVKSISSSVNRTILNDFNFRLGNIPGATCGIISPDMKEFLQTIIDYIRIAGIVLAVVLGILDYIKVIFGSDDKSMAKANKNFSTRLIAVALLFLIPAVLSFVLGLFNIMGSGETGTCGIR